MKRYTLTDNKRKHSYEYNYFTWNFAWVIVFVIGIITGYCI